MISKDDLLREFEQELTTTRRVLEQVPADKLRWQPHEKSMTLGQLAWHIATVPGAIAELATQDSFDVNTQIPRPNPETVVEVLDAFEESNAKVRAVLPKIGDSDLGLKWRMMNGDQELMAITRGQLLRSVMLNHWYHHRGQLTVYLRQVGAMVPAVYGASADENPFAP